MHLFGAMTNGNGQKQRRDQRSAWYCKSCVNVRGDQWLNFSDRLQCWKCSKPKTQCMDHKRRPDPPTPAPPSKGVQAELAALRKKVAEYERKPQATAKKGGEDEGEEEDDETTMEDIRASIEDKEHDLQLCRLVKTKEGKEYKAKLEKEIAELKAQANARKPLQSQLQGLTNRIAKVEKAIGKRRASIEDQEAAIKKLQEQLQEDKVALVAQETEMDELVQQQVALLATTSPQPPTDLTDAVPGYGITWTGLGELLAKIGLGGEGGTVQRKLEEAKRQQKEQEELAAATATKVEATTPPVQGKATSPGSAAGPPVQPKATPSARAGAGASAGGSSGASQAVANVDDYRMSDVVDDIRKELLEAGWPLAEGASDEEVRAAGAKLQNWLQGKRARTTPART